MKMLNDMIWNNIIKCNKKYNLNLFLYIERKTVK